MINTAQAFFESGLIVHCTFSIMYLLLFYRRPNLWMVIAFACVWINMIGLQLTSARLGIWDSPFLHNVAFFQLIIPCFYLYTAELVEGKRKSFSNLIKHFLPFLILYPFLAVMGTPAPEHLIPKSFSYNEIALPGLIILVFLISILFYGNHTRRFIRINQEKYKREYADNHALITLEWIKWVMKGMEIIFAISVLIMVYFLINDWEAFRFEVFIAAVLFGLFSISFFAFRQPVLYKPEVDLKRDQNVKGIISNDASIEKSKKRIGDREIQEIIEKLERYFEEKKPYLDHSIRMPSLASFMNLSTNDFSWLINEYYKKNFFAFINGYRIRHAQKLLKDADFSHYTLEAISGMCGFKSKATFNTRFKEITGKSPSAYRREITTN